ncbi:MAG: D-alanine--D-alanine ligase [Anaerolineales bacterium]|nr:D-alanine--D-alanine ligase [Anaerolineales bacterium]
MPSSVLTLALLFGGRSGEHEVSLMSARSVLSVLDRARYRVIEIGITHEGAWLTGENALAAFEQGQTDELLPVTLHPDRSRPGLYVIRNGSGREILEKLADVDVYFPVLHGSYGEDGTIQGLFEMADAAYVGAGVVGSAVGMDKGVFKEVMRAQGIPVVESILVLRSEIEADLEAVVRRAEALSEYPLFVKPANLGSSVGVTKCRSRSDLAEGLIEAAQYDRRVLVERGVPGTREIEISVLGNDHPQASVAGEIIPGADFYSYDAKYILGNSRLVIPAALTETQADQVRDYALRAFRAVDACGMARVDFFLSEDGQVFLNEINTIPGFTKISMYPKLWEASGLAYSELVNRLIELAMERKRERDRTVRVYRRNA